MSRKNENEIKDAEVGRFLGSMQRAGVDISRIREIARKEKKSVAKVLEEALIARELLHELEDADIKCILKGMIATRELMRMAIEFLADANTAFSSELVRSLVDAKLSGYREARESAAVEEKREKSEKKSEIPEELRRRQMELMMNILDMVISSLTGRQAKPGVPIEVK